MIIILMGVCGSGKTTIGQALAHKLQCGFSDGDSFHPEKNIDKMRAGIPLEDEDRWPWLQKIREAIEEWQNSGDSHVIACSSLKAIYRTILSPENDVVFIYLKGDRQIIKERLEMRTGHYMNPDLLDSQFTALEEPDDAIIIDISQTPDEITHAVLTAITKRNAEITENNRPI